jgi:DUF2950 family protein
VGVRKAAVAGEAAVAEVASVAVAAVAVAAVVVMAAEVVVVAAAVAVGDREEHTMLTHSSRPSVRATVIVALVALTGVRAAAAEAPAQKTFPTPADAMHALAKAARTDDKAALLAILGPGSEDVISSGDPIDDRATGQRFAARVAERVRFWTHQSGAVIANIGKEEWPFAIPLVKAGEGWRFDTAAGRDELLNRRIGRNELQAVDVCRTFVKAENEYARLRGAGSGVVYAQKVRSEPGKQDGLYWDDPTGKNPSPLGPLLAEADAEGYTKPAEGAGPRPFHGYIYRILTGQGAHAPGGAKSYLKDSTMTGGFALLAYPAEHGSSGVMSFIVGPQGLVYQKNLGDKTAEAAKAITAYDPDDSWTPVRD